MTDKPDLKGTQKFIKYENLKLIKSYYFPINALGLALCSFRQKAGNIENWVKAIQCTKEGLKIYFFK